VAYTNQKQRWQKHTFINNSRYDVNIIDSADQATHLTTIAPFTTIYGQHVTQDSKTVVIDNPHIMIDNTGFKWVFSPNC
jgi:hypothetical protein